jgi:hypothetical protein
VPGAGGEYNRLHPNQRSREGRFLVFRVLEYVMAIYKRQMLAWERTHKKLDEFQFQPVLPIVLYSGTRTWDKLEALTALVAQAEGLEEVLPKFEPLFLNFGRTPGETLEERGGSFGLLLQLIQRRHKRLAVFEPMLVPVVRALEEQMADKDRERWRRLVSYIGALIYNEREGAEHEALNQRVLDSLATDPHRAEVFNMGQTMAEMLMEKGRREEAVRRQRANVLLGLRRKFEKVPEGVVKRVETTDNVEQLTTWLDALFTAKKLADVGITPLE